jgi:hypothetical protein
MGQHPNQLAKIMSALYRKGVYSLGTRREYMEFISPNAAGVDT